LRTNYCKRGIWRGILVIGCAHLGERGREESELSDFGGFLVKMKGTTVEGTQRRIPIDVKSEKIFVSEGERARNIQIPQIDNSAGFGCARCNNEINDGKHRRCMCVGIH